MCCIRRYFWVFAWYFLLCFQMTYGKMLLKNIKLDTVWGPVLYTNILSIPPTILLGWTLGDFSVCPLGLLCVCVCVCVPPLPCCARLG